MKHFLNKVNQNGPNGCWVWTGTKHSRGYGYLSFNKKMQLTHRISYQLFVGPIPDGLCVLHECDNPLCVNPDHLFLGTQADNVRDMVEKGRNYRPDTKGEKNGKSKITTASVQEIRSRWPKETQVALAKEYGVNQQTISRIVNREIWSHI